MHAESGLRWYKSVHYMIHLRFSLGLVIVTKKKTHPRLDLIGNVNHASLIHVYILDSES